MFLGCTVFEKNAMLTCKKKLEQFCNFEFSQVSIAFFQPRNFKIGLNIHFSIILYFI